MFDISDEFSTRKKQSEMVAFFIYKTLSGREVYPEQKSEGSPTPATTQDGSVLLLVRFLFKS
jgi:hypothetical protein